MHRLTYQRFCRPHRQWYAGGYQARSRSLEPCASPCQWQNERSSARRL